MADEIQIRTDATGSTVYYVLVNQEGQYWNGSAFEDLVVANWATYDIAMPETPASSYWHEGDMPSVAAGTYYIIIFRQLGGSPAVSDIMVSPSVMVLWTGTALLDVAQTAINLGDIIPAIESRHVTTDALINDVPTTSQITTAILAMTGITVDGTWSFAKLMKVIAAFEAGIWRDKSGTPGVQEVLDPDDESTVVLEVTPKKTTPYRTVTVMI